MTTYQTFQAFWADVMQQYQAQQFAASLNILDTYGANFPQDAPLIEYMRSCMTARTGDLDGALDILQAALERGYWWSEQVMRQTPSWQPLQGLPRFEALTATCIKRQAAAQQEPALLLLEPADGAQPSSVLIALHGNGDTGQNALNGWRAMSEQGWLVAAFQSSQVHGFGAHMWNDQEQAAQDVSSLLGQLKQRLPLDRERTLLAGFSMGGETALRLALNGTVLTRRVLLLGPGGPTMDDANRWRPLLEETDACDLRVYVLLGEQDQTIPQPEIQKLVELLKDHGIACAVELIPNLAHEYPADAQTYIKRALDFLNQED